MTEAASGAFEMRPLAGPFGVEAVGADLETLSDIDLAALLDALFRHRILLVRADGLSEAALIRFARRIGRPIGGGAAREFPEIIPITNVGVDTRASGRGAAHWHSDQSFKDDVSSVTMLYSVQAPDQGGETRFCDLAAAYADLPERTRTRIDDLTVVHRHGVSVAARRDDHVPIPPREWDPATTAYHPLVRRHPITGEKSLYAITGTSQGIVDMEDGQARALLRELCDHALSPPYLSAHRHRAGDLLLWDNPTTLHAATPLGAATGPHDTRRIHRISLVGYPDFLSEPAPRPT